MKGFLITLLSLFTFCNWISQESEIKKVGWLVGTWVNKTSRGNIYENWKQVNTIELAGKSFALREKDTVVFENIRLAQERDTLFYIPVVKNQNNGQPVRFALKSSSATELVFENLKHDFPQRISYSKITIDSLVAQISGSRNGMEQNRVFPMKRVH